MLSGRLLDSHWTKTNSDLELDLQRRLAERHTAIAFPAPPVPGGGASAGIGSASRAPSPGSGWSAAAGPPPWRPPGWPSCPEHSCPARRARACPCTPQRVRGVDPARACPCKQWFRVWVQLVHAPASNGSGCGSSSCMPLQAMVQGVGPARACPFTPDTAIRHCIYYSDTVFFSLFCVCCWGPRL